MESTSTMRPTYWKHKVGLLDHLTWPQIHQSCSNQPRLYITPSISFSSYQPWFEISIDCNSNQLHCFGIGRP